MPIVYKGLKHHAAKRNLMGQLNIEKPRALCLLKGFNLILLEYAPPPQ
jgi:hypothetical protein